MPRYVQIFGWTAIVGVVIDQITKAWVRATLEPGPGGDEITLIPGLLSIVHAKNIGAAFSMLEGQQGLFLVITLVAVVIVAGFLYLIRDTPRPEGLGFTIGLLAGGILGNAIDRARVGEVTDMVKCYWGFEPGRSWLIDQFGTYIYPIWNVADAMLVVGVIASLLYYLFQPDADPLLDDGDEALLQPGE